MLSSFFPFLRFVFLPVPQVRNFFLALIDFPRLLVSENNARWMDFY